MYMDKRYAENIEATYERITVKRDKKEQCVGCWLSNLHCNCESAPALGPPLVPPFSRFLFLTSMREWRRPSNSTVPFRQLSRVEDASFKKEPDRNLVVMGMREQEERSLVPALRKTRCCVLYPVPDKSISVQEYMKQYSERARAEKTGREGKAELEEKLASVELKEQLRPVEGGQGESSESSECSDQCTVIVLDGTWGEARQMNKRLLRLCEKLGVPAPVYVHVAMMEHIRSISPMRRQVNAEDGRVTTGEALFFFLQQAGCPASWLEEFDRQLRERILTVQRYKCRENIGEIRSLLEPNKA